MWVLFLGQICSKFFKKVDAFYGMLLEKNLEPSGKTNESITWIIIITRKQESLFLVRL